MATVRVENYFLRQSACKQKVGPKTEGRCYEKTKTFFVLTNLDGSQGINWDACAWVIIRIRKADDFRNLRLKIATLLKVTRLGGVLLVGDTKLWLLE